jgi:hypothetical protein
MKTATWIWCGKPCARSWIETGNKHWCTLLTQKKSHEEIKERTQWNWLPTRIPGTEKWNQELTGIGAGQNQDAATKTTLSGGKNRSARENE